MWERYYDEKSKDFNDLRLRMLTMENFVTKFVNLQRYVPYLRDENDRFYRFIGYLPPTYKENIEFDIRKPMDEEIGKEKLCYDLFKQWSALTKNWKNKKNEKSDQRKKGFKPSPFRKGTRSHTDKNYNRPSSTNSNELKGIRTSNGG